MTTSDPRAAPPPSSAPVALFISDVHLQPSAPATAQAFLHFLQAHGPGLQQLYLLGDLFEFWVGDDDLGAPFNAAIVAALRKLSDAGVALFWIAGNRDFLIGADVAAATGMRLLADPSVVTIAGQTMVLTHGDAQCTDDVDYQAFRSQVRSSEAQRQFLAMPLPQRHAMVARVRDGSRAAQQGKSAAIMDVNAQAIDALFDQTGTRLMIHGHTHRPARHVTLRDGLSYTRYVLSDWDSEQDAARGGGLAIDADGSFRTIALA